MLGLRVGGPLIKLGRSGEALAGLLEYSASGRINNDQQEMACLKGLAMGLTNAALLHSPFGKPSGGRFNPAVTLAFRRLGKVEPPDALLYALSRLAENETREPSRSFQESRTASISPSFPSRRSRACPAAAASS